jgi:hypothetical protein
MVSRDRAVLSRLGFLGKETVNSYQFHEPFQDRIWRDIEAIRETKLVESITEER